MSQGYANPSLPPGTHQPTPHASHQDRAPERSGRKSPTPDHRPKPPARPVVRGHVSTNCSYCPAAAQSTLRPQSGSSESRPGQKGCNPPAVPDPTGTLAGTPTAARYTIPAPAKQDRQKRTAPRSRCRAPQRRPPRGPQDAENCAFHVRDAHVSSPSSSRSVALWRAARQG